MRHSVARITEQEYLTTAVGYEPTRWDRPPQLRHTLSPAVRIVSNTADGSITSDAIDMAAYARLLLARGDVPDGRGGRIMTDAMFSMLTEDGADDGEGGRYAYGLSQEAVDGHRWIAHSGGMVGYTALLATSPDEGLGLVIMQNGGGDKRLGRCVRARRCPRRSLRRRDPADLGTARRHGDRERGGVRGPLPR